MRYILPAVSAAALMTFTLAAPPAFSATDEEVTAALKAMVEGAYPGLTAEVPAPSTDGAMRIYENVVIKIPGGPEGTVDVTLGTLKITGAETGSAGSVTAEALRIENATVALPKLPAGEEASAALALVEVTNVDIGGKTEAGTAKPMKYDSLNAENLDITVNGKSFINMASLTGEAGDYAEDNLPGSATVESKDIVIDPSAVDQSGAAVAQLQALGYDEFRFNVSATMNWDRAAGTYSYKDYVIEAVDMGKFVVNLTLGGITPEFIQQAQVLNAQVVANPDMAPMMMMPLLAQLNLHELTVTFDDDSITGKILDMQAQQMGADRAAFVEQTTAVLPLMLAGLQNPGLQTKVSEAVTAFLKDPQNISVKIQPEKPVSFSEIMVAGESAPQTIPDILKLEITANE